MTENKTHQPNAEGSYVPVLELDDTYEVQKQDGTWIRVERVIELLSPVHRALVVLADGKPGGGVDVNEQFFARKVSSTSDKDPGEISDGFHTFAELYDHRHALFIALARSNRHLAWRSREHSDGKPMFEGYFIAGISLPTGQISYHLPVALWDHLGDLEDNGVEQPAYDGHSPSDVVQRLLYASYRAPNGAALKTLDQLCEVMHDAYERAAIGAGWETQEVSRKPWANVPEANKATMRVAVSALLQEVG